MTYLLLGLTLLIAFLLPWVAGLDRRPWVMVAGFVVMGPLGKVFSYVGLHPSGLQFGSVSVYPMDLVVVAAIGTVILRLRRGTSVPRPILIGLALLLAILAVNTLRGVALFGLETAVRRSQVVLELLVGIAFGATLTGSSRDVNSFRYAWIVAALTGAGFWLALQATGASRPRPDLIFGLRVLPGASTALVILIGAFALPRVSTSIFADRAHGRGFGDPALLRWLAAGACLAVVILNEVRASWVAAVAGLAAGIVAIPPRLRRWVLGVTVLFTCATSGLVVFSDTGPGAAVRRLLELAVTPGESTASWRIANWRALVGLQVSRGFGTVVVGSPLGTDIERFLPWPLGYWIDVRAHNFLFDLWVDGGLVAVSLFFGIAVLGTWGLVRRAERDPNALWFLMGSIAVFTYGMAWSLTGLLGAFLGAAYAYGMWSEESSVRRPAGPPDAEA